MKNKKAFTLIEILIVGGGAGGKVTVGFNAIASAGGGANWAGGSGGSGIKIVSYKTSEPKNYVGGTITYDGLYTIHTFTQDGIFTKN